MGSARMRAASRLALAAVFFLALAYGLNDLRGATTSGFGSHPDEPAHLVTGLMVRDWLAAPGLPHPLRFAEEYYLHYPKVGIGQWPPVFYGLQGVWGLVFGTSPTAVVLLMSALAGLMATLVFALLREAWGTPAGLVGGALFLLFPIVQVSSGRVMTELPLALFMLLAALAFGRFLDDGKLRHSLAFGLFAVLAILTKGNGIALALLPAFALALGRRWELLRRPALWAAVVPVVLFCAPWYAITLKIATGTWSGGASPSVGYATRALGFYLATFVALGGVGVALCALVGIGSSLRAFAEGRWIALAALLPSLLVVHVLVPSSIDERHWVLAAPAWAAFAVTGALSLARRIGRLPRLAPRLALGLLATAFAFEAASLPRKDHTGFRAGAQLALGDPSLADSVFLISSDSIGEGQFVAEVALHEPRPGHVVLRASKVLCESDWLGTTYRGYYDEPGELMAYLESVPVGLLAFDRSWREREPLPHHLLVERMLSEHADRWELVDALDVVREGDRYPRALELWRQRGHQDRPRAVLDVAQMLGG